MKSKADIFSGLYGHGYNHQRNALFTSDISFKSERKNTHLILKDSDVNRLLEKWMLGEDRGNNCEKRVTD